jgi:hypothetical protein
MTAYIAPGLAWPGHGLAWPGQGQWLRLNDIDPVHGYTVSLFHNYSLAYVVPLNRKRLCLNADKLGALNFSTNKAFGLETHAPSAPSRAQWGAHFPRHSKIPFRATLVGRAIWESAPDVPVEVQEHQASWQGGVR